MNKTDPATELDSIKQTLAWRKKRLKPKTSRELFEETFLDRIGWHVRGSRNFKNRWKDQLNSAATIWFRNKPRNENNMAKLIQNEKSEWHKKHERVERLEWSIRRIMARSAPLNEKSALFSARRLLKQYDLNDRDREEDGPPKNIVIVKTPDDYKKMKKDCVRNESSELEWYARQDESAVGSMANQHAGTPVFRLVDDYAKFETIDITYTSQIAYTYSEAHYYGADDKRIVRNKPGMDLLRAGIFGLVMTYDTLYLIPCPTIKWDEQNRVHCDNGPAVNFMGEDTYRWHNIPIPKKYMMNRKLITAAVIRREANTEVRRCLCEMVGWDKAIDMLKGRIIDEDECLGLPRTLYEIKFGTSNGDWGQQEEVARLLMMTNGTVEDGVRRKFIEVVDEDVETCHEAVAWQLGLREDIYNEGVRT